MLWTSRAPKPLEHCDHADAVLCAGITSLAVCRQDPQACRRINVENSLAVLRQLAGTGTFVVALSTNLVFDGSKNQTIIGYRLSGHRIWATESVA